MSSGAFAGASRSEDCRRGRVGLRLSGATPPTPAFGGTAESLGMGGILLFWLRHATSLAVWAPPPVGFLFFPESISYKINNHKNTDTSSPLRTLRRRPASAGEGFALTADSATARSTTAPRCARGSRQPPSTCATRAPPSTACACGVRRGSPPSAAGRSTCRAAPRHSNLSSLGADECARRPLQPHADTTFRVPRRRGEPCAERWRSIPQETDVLITHGPPLGHGDRCQGECAPRRPLWLLQHAQHPTRVQSQTACY